MKAKNMRELKEKRRIRAIILHDKETNELGILFDFSSKKV
jgi:hypothetical protein